MPDQRPPVHILHLEDNPRDAELAQALLSAEFPGCAITHVDTRDGFLSALDGGGHSLVLADYKLPDFDGLEALQLARARAPHLPFVFLTGTMGEETAVEAVRNGAADYVLKDRMQRLPISIQRALEESATRLRAARAEERMRELAEVLDCAPVAVIISDLSHRNVYWNKGAERIFGWKAEDAEGRTAEELSPPETLAHLLPGRAATFEHGEWRGEVPFFTPDGRRILVDLVMSLIRDDAGRPHSRLTVATDITEKKRLEEQALRMQRMENLGLLAAGIAHDFNNLLAPMMMVVPLLRRNPHIASSEKYLATIEQCTVRGAALVRQILSFAHGGEGGRVLLQPRHLARDLAAMVEATFPPSIQFEAEYPGEPWCIQGNPTHVHQVLLNLCINARDAMPQGGRLRLAIRNCTLDAAAAATLSGGRPGDFVVLEVADTGTGIPPEVMEHIWEPFYSTKGAGKGTGLGLSTVRGIMATHDGFCEVASIVGAGTTFRCYFPAVATGEAGAPAAAEGAAPRIPRGQGELVLVVDDEADVRNIIGATLTGHGYRVLPVPNGVEAVAALTMRKDKIRAVVVDLLMPGLGGEALCMVFRRLNPAVRLLVISGQGEDRAHPGATGEKIGDYFLPKPFRPDDLLAVMHRLLHPVSQAHHR